MDIKAENPQDESSENSESDDGSINEYLETETPGGVKRKHEEDDSHPSKRSNSFRPPTVQELNQFRETENLFSSNLFRIQIEEMIKETQIKIKYQNLFNVWLNNFKTYICTSEKPTEVKFSDMSWSTKLKVSLPLDLSTRGSVGRFTFTSPEDITVGGSYSVRACIGPVYSVDLHIHIPEDCFTMKDVRDIIFDNKRAFYLALLADNIIKSDLVEEIQYLHGNGCPLKPILKLKPSGKLGKHVRVFLWPVTSCNVVKLARLRPDRGNIREVKTDSVVLPSPHYNSGVAQDICWKMNQDLLESELTAPSLREGLILLKVWLRQRHLDLGYGNFGGFIMSMYLVYLLQNKRLNKLMSSYQVVRITWHSLANSDWTSKGISLSSSADSPDISDFHKYFEVVFVDVSGVCNLCANLKKEIYLKVKEESTRALSCLDSSSSNSFQVLFMTPVDFEQSNDYLIRFHCKTSLMKVVENHCDHKDILLHGGWILPSLLKTIMSPLQRGLGQRAVLSFCPLKYQDWKCTDPPPDISQIHDSILLGVRLSSSYAFEVLERGPAADKYEAQEFRDFWGDLSQLRRFKDGSICEAIVWSDQEPICKQIVKHILKRHMGLDKFSYIYVAHLPDALLKSNNPFLENCTQGETAFREALISFEDVTKALRSLSNVTLSVNSVHGISPLFYFAEVFPPIKSMNSCGKWLRQSIKAKHSSLVMNDPLSVPSPAQSGKPLFPPYSSPIEAVMTLELSGKWPQNLAAVRRLKAAFCIQLANALKDEHKITARPQVDHIDILKDGLVFRIWLLALKEIVLMKQTTNELGLIGYRDTPESIFLEEKFVLLPKISSSLNGLQKKFLGFSPTVRVAKRWLSSQLLGPPYIPDIVTELLVSYLFLSPDPFQPPVEPQLGLLQFLRLLSCTDWLTTPIIVNLNSEYTQEKITEIETKFNSSRKSLPPLFISTPYDSQISQFTRKSPTVPILIRLSLLASEALKQLQTQCYFSEVPVPVCTPIFRPCLDEYDVIITLNLTWTTRWMERVDNINWKISKEGLLYHFDKTSIIPVVGFDPVQSYLAELREGYDHCALFFHDLYGGNVIGVLWKPCALEEKNFKVSVVGGHKPTQNSKLLLNVDAILEDFSVIGKGLVQKVVLQTKKEGT